MKKKSIVIVQGYVPHYRKPFFDQLNELLEKENFSMGVLVDGIKHDQNANGDSSNLSGYMTKQRSRRIWFGKKFLIVKPISRMELKADVVVVEQAIKNISNWLLILIRRMFGRPTALWGHGVDYVNKEEMLGSFFRSTMVRLASHIFVYTEGGGQQLVKKGISKRKITVVKNSTDTLTLHSSISQLSLAQKLDFLKKHALSSNLILFLGSLDPSKNLDLLFSAAKVAQRKAPSLSLAIVGDGLLRHQVEEEVKQNDWIKYLGREEEAKVLALSCAQVLVIPGRVGLVATDSFAAGVPIVSVLHDLHAPEFEYLSPGENCLISHGTPEDLGHVILQALSPDFQESARRKALLELDNYSIETMVRNFHSGLMKISGENHA